MTREDLITAIATNLTTEGGIDGMSAPNAAISAIATIEALGFVIVPRKWTPEMTNTVLSRDEDFLNGKFVQAIWDGAIAGSPLYRDGVKG